MNTERIGWLFPQNEQLGSLTYHFAHVVSICSSHATGKHWPYGRGEADSPLVVEMRTSMGFMGVLVFRGCSE